MTAFQGWSLSGFHCNAFKNFVISSLHSGMCKKSKLRVYRELKEDFECKKYLHGVSDMGS